MFLFTRETDSCYNTQKKKGGIIVSLSIGEKIRIIMRRKGVNMAELAEATGQTRQNLSNKMARDNFTEQEAIKMALALDQTVEIIFTDSQTGERI